MDAVLAKSDTISKGPTLCKIFLGVQQFTLLSMYTLWRCMGEISYIPHILNLDITRRWEVRLKLRPL